MTSYPTPSARGCRYPPTPTATAPIAGHHIQCTGNLRNRSSILYNEVDSIHESTPLTSPATTQDSRVAVTGTAVSPPIDATLYLLGRDRTLARLDAALAQAQRAS